MKEYIVVGTRLWRGGGVYIPPGESVKLTDEEAAPLLQKQRIKEKPKKPAAKDKDK